MLGCAPYSRHYKDGTWPLHADPTLAMKARAVALVPAQASASVVYNLDTHMAHRVKIYEFPVPWCNVNWGVRGEHLDDPAGVQYLVLQRTMLGDRDKALLSDLLSNEFVVVSETLNSGQDLVVAKRVRPPAIPLGAYPPEGECYPRASLNSFQHDLQAGG
jgi:hypothetical protein